MRKDIHKWTRGRYTLMFDEHTFFVWDNEKDDRMTALETTERLNEQQHTIKELEKNFEDLADWSTEIAKRNVLLDEKIGRLQQEIQVMKNKLNDCEKFRYTVFKRIGDVLDE